MLVRHSEAIIFSTKAALAAVVSALVYEWLPLPGSAWVAAISAVLVTQPSFHSSWKASLIRVAANISGAFIGAILLTFINQPILAMAIGVMLVGLACYFIGQDEAQRPAFVAVIIVTLLRDKGGWHTSFHRVTDVLIGCLCALAIGFLFDILPVSSKLTNGKDKSLNQ